MLRYLPHTTRGKARVGRAILGPSGDLRDVIVADRYGHRFLVPQVGSPVGFELLIHGVYEPTELAIVLDALPPGATFVDIGANIGCYTLPAARRVGPGGRVLAIEAAPSILPYLENNVSNNGLRNVEIVATAVGEREGRVAFHEAPANSFGMGSIAPQFGALAVQVRITRLDSILKDRHMPDVHVIKVDVEGFELNVFRGAEETLRTQRPLVLFEFLDWAEDRAGIGQVGAAQDLLLEWGYRLWTASAFAQGGPPLAAPIRSGGDMLIARRQ